MTVRRAHVVPRLADERPRDHAPHRVLPREDPPGDAAGVVELLERDRLLVRGDLEDRVGARVDDPLARPLVLLAELLDDLRPARGHVPEHAVPRLVHERVDHLVREPVRVGRHRLRSEDPHQLPVAGRGVLATRPLEQPPRDGRRPRLRRAAEQRLDVPEAQRLERGQVEPADRPRDVPERIRAFVAEIRCVGELAGPDRVEHNHARPGHPAILRPSGERSWSHRLCGVHPVHDRARGRHHLGGRQDQPEPEFQAAQQLAR